MASHQKVENAAPTRCRQRDGGPKGTTATKVTLMDKFKILLPHSAGSIVSTEIHKLKHTCRNIGSYKQAYDDDSRYCTFSMYVRLLHIQINTRNRMDGHWPKWPLAKSVLPVASSNYYIKLNVAVQFGMWIYSHNNRTAATPHQPTRFRVNIYLSRRIDCTNWDILINTYYILLYHCRRHFNALSLDITDIWGDLRFHVHAMNSPNRT